MKIVGVAIRLDGKVHSLLEPYRHHDVIRYLAGAGHPTPIKGVQGFITDTGEFLNRERALKLAREFGLVVGDTTHSKELFSEDLW